MSENAVTPPPATFSAAPDTTAAAADAPGSAPLFPLGRVAATPAALDAAKEHRIDVDALLARHEHGDWGEVPPEDAAANTSALRHGERILSSYSQGNAQLWIITEADRSVTTILRPEDY